MSDARTFQSQLKMGCVPWSFTTVALLSAGTKRGSSVPPGQVTLGWLGLSTGGAGSECDEACDPGRGRLGRGGQATC